MAIAVVIIAVAAVYVFLKQPAGAPADNNAVLSASEALAIAKNSDCAKSGQVQEESFYNENSQTWWFTLKAEKAGCNPACVVAADKTAEINWRCTGLLSPEVSPKEEIRAVLAAKYPKYADTLTVSLTQERGDYVRGGVSFAPGAPGGIFLAARVNGQWQIAHDGNGQIPCTLSSSGFPADMLVDCVK
jgi:hypothetical protein